MSDFDDLYEAGLVDKSGMPTWADEINNNKLQSNEYYVELTPKKYLFDNGTTIASELETRKEVDNMEEVYLEIQHDRYNIHDKYALKVLYKSRFIGYITKNSLKNSELICFDNKGFIKDLSIRKENYKYIIKIGNEKTHFHSDFEKIEKILYKDRNIQPKKSEVDTILYVIKNQNNYKFTDEELDMLKLRKNIITINSTGKVLGSATKTTLQITEKTLGVTEKVVRNIFGKIFK
jgi:hypothetical protein